MNFYRTSISLTDSVELLEVFDSKKAYPAHYHDCFCLSLVNHGIFMENDKLIAQDCLLITNPNQVHINTTYRDLSYSLTTVYISQNFVNDVLSSQVDVRFCSMVYDSNVINAMRRLFFAIKSKSYNDMLSPCLLSKALLLLKPFATYDDTQQPISYDWVEDIQAFIMDNLEQKILITDLEKISKLDKFKLIRQFKAHVGMTPIQYLTLQRIILAKQLLQDGVSLNETALTVGFYDHSNFSNYFKRYIGVTPKAFQRAVCNIFQD